MKTKKTVNKSDRKTFPLKHDKYDKVRKIKI